MYFSIQMSLGRVALDPMAIVVTQDGTEDCRAGSLGRNNILSYIVFEKYKFILGATM